MTDAERAAELVAAIRKYVCRLLLDRDAQRTRADAAERDLEAWRSLFGCDSPHDACVGDEGSALGQEQARANRAEKERDEAVAAAARLREALAWTLPFREFSDSWHNAENVDVVEFRRLRNPERPPPSLT